MRLYPLLIVGFSALSLACGSEAQSPGGGSAGAGGGGGGAGGAGGQEPTVCGTARGMLDETALVELSHDDGEADEHIRQKEWSITTSAEHKFNEVVLHEAARFELDHPARIHGFKVMWASIPEGAPPTMELEAGLYADFGYNGFDFWAPDPLWTGTRCLQDLDAEPSWTSYAFEEPIVLSHPGLVYVAHRTEPGSPVWWLDADAEIDDDPCSHFDECKAAFNMPEVDTGQFFNGLSFSFQYPFMVRLLVEYTDNVQLADKLFQAVDAAPTNGHVSWGDYDNDGYDDLLLGAKLWRNQGDGSFTDVSTAAGLDGISATGGIWGDYDNDGCLDLFLFVESTSATDLLMHSDCSGAFVDVSASAGIVDFQTYNDCGGDAANTASPSAAASWIDVDSDGYLDLYVNNFICWSQENYYVDTVFYNDADGTFSEWTSQNGFSDKKMAGRCSAPIDHDNDGDVDLWVGNYRLHRNLFFSNDGDGTVSESAIPLGLAGDGPLAFGHTIGLAWGDLDNDGDFDGIAANLAHPRFFGLSDKTQVLINDGSGSYSDLAGDWSYPASGAGLRYQETHSVPALADFDNDGVLDLAITCVYDGRPSDFYWGKGDGTFTLDAYHAGITTENGWGLAAADFDHDGDMDLFATNLFENTGSGLGHWLQVRVVGTTANWAAIGASVKVTTGDVTRLRHVQGGTGKGGQDSLYLHYGLADASTVDEIRVVFPGGDEIVYSGPITVDQRVWLYQDEAQALMGWAPPK